MPGLCLLDIGSAPYIGYNIMPQKAYFHIFDFLLIVIFGFGGNQPPIGCMYAWRRGPVPVSLV